MGLGIDAGAEPPPAAACAPCHAEAVAEARTSPHGRAAAALTEATLRAPACLRCHLSAPTRPWEGVSCAGCHTRAAEHLRAPRGQAARAAAGTGGTTCARCHEGVLTRTGGAPLDPARVHGPRPKED